MRNFFVIALAIGYPVLALWQIHRTTTGGSGALRDRLELLIVLAAGVLFLMFSRAVADWQALSPWLWLLGLLLLAAAVVLAGRAWTHLAWLKSPHPRRRAASTTAQLLLAAAAFTLLL